MKRTAIYYGSTTGTTKEISDMIGEKLGADIYNVADGFDSIENYGNLIFASSTWGYGELQDDWIGALDELANVDLNGKKVAFLGTGDSASFESTFVDAIGIIYDAIVDSGASFVGQIDKEGYEYSGSTGERDGKLLGLAIDQINEEDKTEERISNWIEILNKEFE